MNSYLCYTAVGFNFMLLLLESWGAVLHRCRILFHVVLLNSCNAVLHSCCRVHFMLQCCWIQLHVVQYCWNHEVHCCLILFHVVQCRWIHHHVVQCHWILYVVHCWVQCRYSSSHSAVLLDLTSLVFLYGAVLLDFISEIPVAWPGFFKGVFKCD